MELIELGTRNAFKSGTSLCFFVPKSWIGDHGLDFGEVVYLHCGAVTPELRYYTRKGPGRVPMLLQERPGGKPLLVIPKHAVERFGIEARTPLSIFTNPKGTLIVRRAE